MTHYADETEENVTTNNQQSSEEPTTENVTSDEGSGEIPKPVKDKERDLRRDN